MYGSHHQQQQKDCDFTPTMYRMPVPCPHRVALKESFPDLYLPDALPIADTGKRCHLHDGGLAAVRAAPSKGQRGSRRKAMATGLGMLHWWQGAG
jgi:hypothetical protein